MWFSSERKRKKKLISKKDLFYKITLLISIFHFPNPIYSFGYIENKKAYIYITYFRKTKMIKYRVDVIYFNMNNPLFPYISNKLSFHIK